VVETKRIDCHADRATVGAEADSLRPSPEAADGMHAQEQ